MVKKTGFTLIELLVVITIIGVLSAVVLAALNTARAKGNDAAVKSNIDGIRTEAQIYFHDNGNYGTNTADESSCVPAVATDNMFGIDTTIEAQIAAAAKANVNAGITCNVAANGTAYAISVALIATPGTFYCVDSVGMGTTTTKVLGAATNC